MGIAISETPHVVAPVPGSSIDILGIEITQAIQNLANDVPLVRSKSAVARVYFTPNNFAGHTSIQGEIAVSPSAGSPAKYVASMSAIDIPAGSYPGVPAQRRNIGLSLNFILPADVLGWAGLSVTVKRIFSAAGDITLHSNKLVSKPLIDAPPLRIKAIGLRYVLKKPGAPPAYIAPDAFHFDFLRSFLGRAYPVSKIIWSQFVVPADRDFTPPFSDPNTPEDEDDPVWLAKLDIAHNQMSTIRAKDIDALTDPRTHYYGLVSDANKGLFFRGAAKDIPQTPNPSVVAVGPVGDPRQYSGFRWDTDRSYGDWYGSHELAHTFGRSHPGFCKQDASDPTFPYADGRIGDNAHGDMIGLDMGDPGLSLKMRAMANETCHDIMTYCDNQWISAYSYQAILQRLIDEESAFAPIAGT